MRTRKRSLIVAWKGMAETSSGETKQIQTDLESTLESVDRAEDLVLEVARRLAFDEEELHRIGMAVRECMVNAVVHGNRYSAHKKVHLSVTTDRDRLTVAVRDQGQGFDLQGVPDPLAGDNIYQQSGRGIFLMRAFVDEVQVRRLVPVGTEVRLVKYTSAK